MVNLRRVLWHLLGGTRGGPLRIRILLLLRDRPYNTNQLARLLDVDYKSVQHHLKVLRENRVLERRGSGYGDVFFLSPDMEQSVEEFVAIARKVAPRVVARHAREFGEGGGAGSGAGPGAGPEGGPEAGTEPGGSIDE